MKPRLASVLVLTALSCSPRPPATAPGIELDEPSHAPPAALPIHINDDWWPVRARHLGISELELAQRDANVGAARVPDGFWDSQTAVEAVSVWTVLCNQCHGGRRQLEDVDEMPEPPADWGTGSGLFFGSRRHYSHLFNIVHDGSPRKEEGRPSMPAWRTVLSNEMIWAMLYFLEYQSGGIESRFPPSLYPRLTLPPR